MYEKGWLATVPTAQEAALLARVRHEVAAAVGLDINCTTPEELTGHYLDLMAKREAKFGAAIERGNQTWNQFFPYTRSACLRHSLWAIRRSGFHFGRPNTQTTKPQPELRPTLR
ncbi:MAG: hypothetical protein WCF44_13105 [Candidatus Methylophosphatis roskildensis]